MSAIVHNTGPLSGDIIEGDDRLVIEPYQPGHFELLNELYREVHGQPGHHLLKKMDTSYAGLGPLGMVALNNRGSMVGYYGVLPVLVQHRNQQGLMETFLAGQSADTMIHPDYRLQGLFLVLSEQCFELCKSAGVKWIFGFPNQNSLKGALKLGWQQQGQIMRFSLWMAEGTVHGSLKNRLERRMHIQLSRVHAPQASRLEPSDCQLVYDAAYWRYKAHQQNFWMRIGQTHVWLKVRGDQLLIGGISRTRHEDIRALVKSLQKITARLHLHELVCLAAEGSALFHQLSALYDPQPAFPLLLHMLGRQEDLPGFTCMGGDLDTF